MIGWKGSRPAGVSNDGVAERGVASMARARSLQSRLSSALAMLLCAGLGLGLLIWYYAGILAHRSTVTSGRHNPVPAVVSDSSLPPLGPIRDPRAVNVSDAQPLSSSTSPASGSPATLPVAATVEGPPLTPAATIGTQVPAPPQPQQTAFERRLAGPAFAATSGQAVASVPTQGADPEATPNPATGSEHAEHVGGLADLLAPTVMPASRARDLPTQQLLLAKGAFIDCTLETAIDSSLPGMTTCITATDTFSVDGKVVLLERGSKLIGETRGQVQQGSARLFVLWTEARTPTGVIVPLASPGADALGRSGLDGEVERHFWQRFGAAILISMVDGVAQAAQRSGGSGTVIYDTSSSQGVATEALRGTIGIAPTITKHQGDRIQILVARDLDFRQVYQLQAPEAAHQQ
jgi:type IV secretion system protein VirB10